MSIMVNDFFYSRPYREEKPVWYRPERCDYCDQDTLSTLSAKRSFFSRSSKKRSK